MDGQLNKQFLLKFDLSMLATLAAVLLLIREASKRQRRPAAPRTGRVRRLMCGLRTVASK